MYMDSVEEHYDSLSLNKIEIMLDNEGGILFSWVSQLQHDLSELTAVFSTNLSCVSKETERVLLYILSIENKLWELLKQS